MSTRAAYDRSHGVCAWHAAILEGGLAGPARDLAQTRLAVLTWELDELDRKSRWSTRHEPSGPEGDAWLRAFAAVDGHAFLGGPARGSGQACAGSRDAPDLRAAVGMEPPVPPVVADDSP